MSNNSDNVKLIGRNIRIVRKSKGLSQYELAVKSGYKTGSFIEAIENGNSTPSFEKLKEIANALDVSISQLKPNEFINVKDKNWLKLEEHEVEAMNILAPMIKVLTEEDSDMIIDYIRVVLKANNKTPDWKKPPWVNKAIDASK